MNLGHECLVWRLEQRPTNTSPFYWVGPKRRRLYNVHEPAPLDLAWRVEPVSFDALLDKLKVSGASRDLLQSGTPPYWMLCAVTLAEEINANDMTQIVGVSPVCGQERRGWRSERTNGTSVRIIHVQPPVPTPRGPWQQGWPPEAGRFISEVISRKKNAARLMLAEAMGLHDDYLIYELS